MMVIANKILIGVSVIALLFSMRVYGDALEQSSSKISIVVDGMMKSKSGAT